MQVRDLLSTEVESARLLLCAHGWAHRIESSEWFAQLVAASQRTAVAVDAGEVVGFARGITDGLSNGYLSMVVVAPGHRGKGLGVSAGTLVGVSKVIGDYCAFAQESRQLDVCDGATARGKPSIREPHWNRIVVVMLLPPNNLAPMLDCVCDCVGSLLWAIVSLFKHLGLGEPYDEVNECLEV